MNRTISPPPTKRRRLNSQTITTPSPGAAALAASEPQHPPSPSAHTLRIFSWNINGITPFLQQPSITKYLSSNKQETGRGGALRPSLRACLKRWHWPEIVCLQEIKIAAGDAKTLEAVRRAVNARVSARSRSRERDGEGRSRGSREEEKGSASESESRSGSGTAGKEEPEGGMMLENPAYEVHFTLPTDRHNARGLRNNMKLYGVATIIRSDIYHSHVSCIRSVDWDNEGRISVLEISPKPTTKLSSSPSSSSPSFRKLALFNIYAVNGTDAPYRDPKTGDVIGTRHDRKLAFHRLLRDECVQMEKQGWHVLLVGDMNVAPDARDGYPRLHTWPVQHVRNREHFHTNLLSGSSSTADCGVGSFDGERKEEGVNEEMNEKNELFRGIDIWRAMHPSSRRYTYHSRTRKWGTSCDRVDYFIASQKLWDGGLVRSCGILDSEEERGPSDHVPIWAEVSIPGSHVMGSDGWALSKRGG